MKLLFFLLIISSVWGHEYRGLPNETQTKECARHEILNKSKRSYPFPNFNKIISLKSKNLMPFWIRPSSTYKFVAINEAQKKFTGKIVVSNFTRSKFINGQKQYSTTCRMLILPCEKTAFGFYSLKVYDESKSLILDHWNRGCALKQKLF